MTVAEIFTFWCSVKFVLSRVAVFLSLIAFFCLCVSEPRELFCFSSVRNVGNSGKNLLDLIHSRHLISVVQNCAVVTSAKM